jgi:pyruvate,water dikinase
MALHIRDLQRIGCGPRTLRALNTVQEAGFVEIDTYVRDISTLRITDAEEAGGKGANMGEMVAAKLPVPPGFVMLRDCYRDSMRDGGVDEELSRLHREALTADMTHLPELCERLQGLVHKAGIADSVRDRILAAYRALGADAVVAVRSSRPAKTAATHRSPG